MTIEPAVILIAGPAGSGKTTTAARIAQHPGWIHVSEDEHWVQIKLGRPAGELRTPEEQDVVQQQVIERVLDEVARGHRVAVEFILYEDPPRPLLRYQEALAERGVTFVTRILRPDVEEIVRRISGRGRPGDVHRADLREIVEHQVRVLASPHISPAWVIDSTDLSVDEVYSTQFAPLLEQPSV